MNAMDILGALVGKKRQSGGLGSAIGGKILKDLLGGGARRAPAPTPAPKRAPAPAPRRQAERPPQRRGSSLEDLLHQSNEHYAQRKSAPAPTPPPRVAIEAFDDEAEVLVRAMVNAAKSDGQIDKDEQEAIIKQLGDVSQQQIDFLRKEFTAKSDVREFAWSVPIGQEENVYVISLMSIDLDANSEAKYLQELAHGLRLDAETCNALHDKLKAPRIYS